MPRFFQHGERGDYSTTSAIPFFAKGSLVSNPATTCLSNGRQLNTSFSQATKGRENPRRYRSSQSRPLMIANHLVGTIRQKYLRNHGSTVAAQDIADPGVQFLEGHLRIFLPG